MHPIETILLAQSFLFLFSDNYHGILVFRPNKELILFLNCCPNDSLSLYSNFYFFYTFYLSFILYFVFALVSIFFVFLLCYRDYENLDLLEAYRPIFENLFLV